MKWLITVETFDVHGNLFDHLFEEKFGRAGSIAFAVECAVDKHRADLISCGKGSLASRASLPDSAIAVNVVEVRGVPENDFEQRWVDNAPEELNFYRERGWLTRPLNRF